MQHYESDIFTLCDLESHYKVVQVRFFVLSEKCVKNFTHLFSSSCSIRTRSTLSKFLHLFPLHFSPFFPAPFQTLSRLFFSTAPWPFVLDTHKDAYFVLL